MRLNDESSKVVVTQYSHTFFVSLSRHLLFSVISFFEVLTRITGCASWTEYDAPIKGVLREVGVSIPPNFCRMSVPICTALEFSDGFEEALSELASQLGSFVSSSSSGRRLNENYCSDHPGITFGLKFTPGEWSESVRRLFLWRRCVLPS